MPKIGIEVQPINSSNAALLGLQPGVGWYLSAVYPSSPASVAGLQVGDFIVSAGGRTLYSVTVGDPLADAKAGKPSGSTLQIEGFRLVSNASNTYCYSITCGVTLP